MGIGLGFGCFVRGLAMWRRRPGLMLLGMLPALLVLLVLTALLVGLLLVVDDVVGWATPFADDWDGSARTPFRFVLGLAVVLGAGWLAIMSFTGLTLAVGDPIYERIWRQTEVMLGGPVPEHGVSWWRSARDGLTLVALGVATSLAVFAVGLVPVVGAVAAPVVGVLVSGRLLARELVSRPLEARGMSRAEQTALLRGRSGALFGFGGAVQLCFLVPFGAVLMMPAAVAGATMLAREALDRSAPAALGTSAPAG
jgi:CysZ protein